MKKGNYIVKDGYTIKHDGQEYQGGDKIELTKEQAEKLHVESAEQYKARQVLEGKDSYADSPALLLQAVLSIIKMSLPSIQAHSVCSFGFGSALSFGTHAGKHWYDSHRTWCSFRGAPQQ